MAQSLKDRKSIGFQNLPKTHLVTKQILTERSGSFFSPFQIPFSCSMGFAQRFCSAYSSAKTCPASPKSSLWVKAFYPL